MKLHLKQMAQRSMIRKLVLTAILLCTPHLAGALESDRTQPIEVNANKATLDDKKSLAVYEGDVVLTQGTLRIKADKLTIKASNSGNVEEVIATGKFAEFTQTPEPEKEPIEAKAEHILYQVVQEKITLTRSASVIQNNNLFQGNVITYDIKQQKLSASGPSTNRSGDQKDTTGRVKVILTPPPSASPAPNTENNAGKNEQIDSVPSSEKLQK
ncbi:lipopolysaccharide transport periplasmic protein LptA [Gammaproteobacteria bacterium 45_16_T64]|nr:lipopolysaccharide transport periplasmic protein LptA [Gammaproteobacteria bacterium 45_16_T64]